MAAAILAAPLGWRVALRARGGPNGTAASADPPSYLPALEETRARRPFNAEPIDGLRRLAPGYVIIGDSMAGRIDPVRLEELTHTRIAPILQNATGPAYWYLVFKNYVVASGIRPKSVIVFFRDTNMTDPLFRIGDVGGGYRHLDEVALDREDELNAVVARRVDPWYRAHRLIAHAYGIDEARAWLEPKLSAWAAARVAPSRHERLEFLEDLNGMFALDHLRPMPAADIAAAEARDLDFAANVGPSVLPLFLQLAEAHDLHLCFVRVLRRPLDDGRLPPESARMGEYVRDLRAYLESHGAVYRDDRDDPVMATIKYADGDHIGRGERVRYTDRFFAETPIFR